MNITNYFRTTIAVLFSLVLFMGLQACSDNSTGFREPDFSEVPPPFDVSQAESTIEQENGLVIHIIERSDDDTLEGVIERDQIRIHYTGRTNDGTVFASSYANGSEAPATFNNLTPSAIGNTSALIEGFRQGLLGMYPGEKRKIIIPPSLGYGNAQQGTNGYDLRDDTLVYDVELNQIFN